MKSIALLSIRTACAIRRGLLLLSFLLLAHPCLHALSWTNRGDFSQFAGLHGVVWGNGTFVAVGDHEVLTSGNGEGWTNWGDIGGVYGVRCVTFGNGLFVGGLGDGNIITSPNGWYWINRGDVGGLYSIVDITFGNGVFLAVSVGGYALTSSNGVDWYANPVGHLANAVTWGNGVFVAVTDTGTVLTSPNGANWTNRGDLTAGAFTDVTWGNGRFVAVTTQGRVFSSTDGSSWADRGAPAGSAPLSAVAWGNGLFVAGNSNGALLTSADGVSWASDGITVSNKIRGLTWGNDRWVAVTDDGSILSAPYWAEITVEQPAGAPLTSGASTVGFGSVGVGGSVTKTFVIRNNFANGANLSPLSITWSGTHATDYTVSTSGLNTNLPPNGSTTFTVTFNPTASGPRTATLRIASNDADENPFVITLSGSGVAPGPEIVVEQPAGSGLTAGESSRSFGTVVLGGSASRTFTVKNAGSANLTGLSVSAQGVHGADFTLAGPGVATLAPGGSTTFTVTFQPSAPGPRTATIFIASNDGDENPFDIALTGSGATVGPDIVVEQPAGYGLTSGSGTRSFASVAVGGSVTRTFTVRNWGIANLVGLSISKDGGQSAEFTVGALGATTLASGASTTFAVTFRPGAIGPRKVTVRIASNDADENPFAIALSGYGYVPAPEIEIEQPVGTGLSNGGSKSFGSVNVGSSTSRVFTVRNTGTATLTGLSIASAGAHVADFTVAPLGATTLAPGASATFTATFRPTSFGDRTATLQIASNDADENPFLVALTGSGLAPEIVVEQPAGASLTSGAATRTFGTVAIGGSASLSFAVKNIGTANLTGLGVTIDGPAASMFNVTTSPVAPVAGPGGVTTFTVRFAPTSGGPQTAVLRLASNDSNENPFEIALSGTGASSNANLANLTVSGSALTPAFSPATTAYTATVTNPTISIVVTPVPADSAATVKIDGVSIPAGGAGGIDLVVGANVIPIEVTAASGATKTYTLTVVRLAPAPGDRDPGFHGAANLAARSAIVHRGGNIFVGGHFTDLRGIPRNFMAKLNSGGWVDATFNPAPNGYLSCIATRSVGDLIVGGDFSQVAGTPVGKLVTVRDGFGSLGADPLVRYGPVHCVAIQPDGKAIVGGGFTSVSNVTRNRIARLGADGSLTLDAAFNPNANGNIHSIAIEPGGTILVGGDFMSIGGVARGGLARLSSAGVVEPAFALSGTQIVTAIAIQADGKILVGGLGLRRYLADGTLDTGFAGIGGTVNTLAVQADGRILVGGGYLAGSPGKSIVRLNPNGTLDSSFNARVDGTVYGATLQADGKVVITGHFTAIDGLAWQGFGRLLNSPATQTLSVPGPDRVQWLRGGASPETHDVGFDFSADGVNWTPLGAGTRIAGGWERRSLALPVSGYLRAQARVACGYRNGSSQLVESVVRFGL